MAANMAGKHKWKRVLGEIGTWQRGVKTIRATQVAGELNSLIELLAEKEQRIAVLTKELSEKNKKEK